MIRSFLAAIILEILLILALIYRPAHEIFVSPVDKPFEVVDVPISLTEPIANVSIPIPNPKKKDVVEKLLVQNDRKKATPKKVASPSEKNIRPVKPMPTEAPKIGLRTSTNTPVKNSKTAQNALSKITSPPSGNAKLDTGSPPAKPSFLAGAIPVYPKRAEAYGIEGTVRVKLHIGLSGEVEHVSLINADEKWGFFESIRVAVKSWRYQKKIENGKPVAYDLEITFVFRPNLPTSFK